MATFQVQKRAQDLQIGPTFRHITGLSDDGVVVAQMGDIGAVITGIQGDTQIEAYGAVYQRRLLCTVAPEGGITRVTGRPIARADRGLH